MTREQAINYLFSRGFTNEQVGEVVRALTYKPRDCANCKHYVVTDTRTNWGSQETTKIYGCECWECEYEPTTKNDCEHCSKTYGTLGCCDFVSNEPVYSCKEGHEEYARGIRKLGSTTKNNLGVDCINKADFVKKLESETIGLQSWQKALIYQVMDDCHSVTPQEPQEQQTFKWCTDCKEYDQEKHCCHRWSKVIRDTVEEMKQEPILDKIRAEIETKYGQCDICEYFEDYDYEENDISEYRPIGNIADILQIINKYKAESEAEDGNVDN